MLFEPNFGLLSTYHVMYTNFSVNVKKKQNQKEPNLIRYTEAKKLNSN